MPPSLLSRFQKSVSKWRKHKPTLTRKSSFSTTPRAQENIQVSVAESVYATSHRMPSTSPAPEAPRIVVPSLSAMTAATLVSGPSSGTQHPQELAIAHRASCFYDHLSAFKASLQYDISARHSEITPASPEAPPGGVGHAAPLMKDPFQEELLSLVNQIEDLRRKVAAFATRHAGAGIHPDFSPSSAVDRDIEDAVALDLEELHPDASTIAIKYRPCSGCWASITHNVTPEKNGGGQDRSLSASLQSPFSLLKQEGTAPPSSPPALPELDTSFAEFADVSFNDSLKGQGTASVKVA